MDKSQKRFSSDDSVAKRNELQYNAITLQNTMFIKKKKALVP